MIAYATWTGTTRTVAEAIAERLRSSGIEVSVQPADAVADLSPYGAVVLGVSVHAGKVPGVLPRFVKRFREPLTRMPVAWYVVCLTMCEDTAEKRQEALAYLEPLRRAAPALEFASVGLFAGTVLTDTDEYRRLFPILRLMAGTLARNTKDYRDWEAIRAWADEVRPLLTAS